MSIGPKYAVSAVEMAATKLSALVLFSLSLLVKTATAVLVNMPTKARRIPKER